jgi:aminoglycoside/choline kinase family phosphotransferase
MSAISEALISQTVIELAAQCLNTQADAVTITPVTGDASTRAYFRAKAGDASVIIALYGSPFDERVPAADRLSAAEVENPAARLTFASDPCAYLEVTSLFLNAGLPVPRILISSGVNRVILMEDVGDARMQDWMETRSEAEVKTAYRRAIELIVAIQAATNRAMDTACICSHLAFDEAKLRWELGFFFVNYVNKYLGLKLIPAQSNAIQQDFKALCGELASRPRVLTHRDYHTRNLMMRGDDIIIIDHQDARMGPASYDVASFLSDPYARIQEDVSDEMLELFIEKKALSSVPLESVEEFRREMHLMTVQRMLKAIGTYAYQAAVMNNLVYIDYIGPAKQAALKSMQALGLFDSTRALLENQ